MKTRKYSAAIVAAVLFLGADHATAAPDFPESAAPLGLLRDRLDLGHARLCATPLDSEDFVLSDLHFKLNRRFNNYSGDISGRMLGALGSAEGMLGKRSGMLEVLLAALPQLQQPDGHFGAPQHLDTDITQERDMPILWGNGRLLRAVAEQLRRDGSPELRDVAVRLGDYVCATRKYYGKPENFARVGGKLASGFTTCYPSLIDGLVQLGDVTGESRYLDEARFIGRLALLDDNAAGRHSHGLLIAYRGMLELDLLTGTRDFVDAAAAGVRKIAESWRMPTGGVPEVLDVDYLRDEGCSEADWLWVHLLLWRATGEKHWLDDAEFALRNHLFATQFPFGGFGHFAFPSLKAGGASYRWTAIDRWASDSYWCCSMHGTQFLADLANWAVLAENDTVYVTLLAAAQARVRVPDGPVSVTVHMESPHVWNVGLEVLEGLGAVEGELRVRIPAHLRVLDVPGAVEEGWAVIRGTLEDQAAFRFVFEPEVSREPVPGAGTDAGPWFLRAGQDLYGLPDTQLPEGLRQSEEVPSIVLEAGARPTPGGWPAVLETGDGRIRVNLVPLMDRPPARCRLAFLAREAAVDEFAALTEGAASSEAEGLPVVVQAASSGPYDIYLDGQHVFHGHGADESPLVYLHVPSGTHTLAVAGARNDGTPGIIAQARPCGPGQDNVVSSPEGWTAHGADAAGPRLDLAALRAGGSLPVEDIGPWGIPPWDAANGHFMATGAHWIWAEAPESATHVIFLREIEVKR